MGAKNINPTLEIVETGKSFYEVLKKNSSFMSGMGTISEFIVLSVYCNNNGIKSGTKVTVTLNDAVVARTNAWETLEDRFGDKDWYNAKKELLPVHFDEYMEKFSDILPSSKDGLYIKRYVVSPEIGSNGIKIINSNLNFAGSESRKFGYLINMGILPYIKDNEIVSPANDSWGLFDSLPENIDDFVAKNLEQVEARNELKLG